MNFKKYYLLAFAILLFFQSHAQLIEGKVTSFKINAKTLQNNAGENPNRKVSVYLPPNYYDGKKRFPVIYYMHGYLDTDSIRSEMKTVFDKAIIRNKIRPFILVIANHNTLYEGSFYSNSALTGNWADFSAKELVAHIDKNFRTIATRDSRGIAGHSMGGHGAIKMGMLYPDIFSSVYAMSPGVLAFVKEFGPNSDTFKQLSKITSEDDLKKTYFPRVLVAAGRAWSPNPYRPPFFCDMPFTYKNDSLVIDEVVLEKWHENMPVYMVEKYSNNLRKLKAFKVDWGRNDAPRFPVQIGMLSQRMENLGIEHFAEEYIGDHGNKIWTPDGRVLNDLLPFFDEYLTF